MEPKAARAKKSVLGPTGAVVASCAVVLGGLFAWGAYDGFSNHANHAWETVPQGQPYYVPHATPVPPAGAATTTAKKLPAMVVTTPSATVTLTVDAPPLGGLYGTDGQVQDTFTPSYFAVPAGQTIHVTVMNHDTAWHTFTSPMLGLNVFVPPGGTHPTPVHFTFKAPKSGYYEWFCDVPCDSYSMSHAGYMEGEIHAVKS